MSGSYVSRVLKRGVPGERSPQRGFQVSGSYVSGILKRGVPGERSPQRGFQVSGSHVSRVLKPGEWSPQKGIPGERRSCEQCPQEESEQSLQLIQNRK